MVVSVFECKSAPPICVTRRQLTYSDDTSGSGVAVDATGKLTTNGKERRDPRTERNDPRIVHNNPLEVHSDPRVVGVLAEDQQAEHSV